MRTVSFLGQLIWLPSEQIVCCSLNCRCWQLGDWILHSEGLNLPGGNLPHNPPKKCPIGKLYFSEHTYTFMAEHATLISVIVSIILMFSTAMLHKHTFCLTSVHSYQFFFQRMAFRLTYFDILVDSFVYVSCENVNYNSGRTLTLWKFLKHLPGKSFMENEIQISGK